MVLGLDRRLPPATALSARATASAVATMPPAPAVAITAIAAVPAIAAWAGTAAATACWGALAAATLGQAAANVRPFGTWRVRVGDAARPLADRVPKLRPAVASVAAR